MTVYWILPFFSSLLGEKGALKHKDNKSIPQNLPYALLPKYTFPLHFYGQVHICFSNGMVPLSLMSLQSHILEREILSIGLELKPS